MKLLLSAWWKNHSCPLSSPPGPSGRARQLCLGWHLQFLPCSCKSPKHLPGETRVPLPLGPHQHDGRSRGTEPPYSLFLVNLWGFFLASAPPASIPAGAQPPMPGAKGTALAAQGRPGLGFPRPGTDEGPPQERPFPPPPPFSPPIPACGAGGGAGAAGAARRSCGSGGGSERQVRPASRALRGTPGTPGTSGTAWACRDPRGWEGPPSSARAAPIIPGMRGVIGAAPAREAFYKFRF